MKHERTMKRHLLSYLVLAITLITLTSAKPIKTRSGEAVVVGRLVIDSDSPLETEKLSIRFINGTKGGKTVKINADGFFCIKIGVGTSFIDYIQYKNSGTFQKIFTEDCAILSLPTDKTVYYVGDIQLQWSPSERDKVKKAFSLGIGMGGAHMGGGVAIPIQSGYAPNEECPPLDITEYTDAVNWYKQNYLNDEREIVTQLIDVDN